MRLKRKLKFFFLEKLPDRTIELFTERVKGSCDGV
jgi:hypothetical protein